MGEALAGQGAIHVLHVDDDAMFSDLVATYLEQLDDDITVLTEDDAGAALDRLAHHPVDCIISDYEMPGMDGLELLGEVRERYPNIPFILFTGRGSEDVASEAINAGVSAYVQKAGSESYELLTNQVQNNVARLRSERQARVATDQLLELYEQADGFYTLGADWTVTYWNRRVAERTGRPSREVLGMNIWEAFPEATDEVRERFERAMAEREAIEFETYYDPLEYWAEVRIYPNEDAGGLFVHTRDITALKERERELKTRNQALESFANTVSHDLRNPLSVAEGRLQLAERTGDFDHLDEVAQAHNRMRNLIDELLRVARDKEAELSPVALETAAVEAWETTTLGGATLDVVDNAEFDAHASQLRRLFENLFWNANEHGGADTVRVGQLSDGFYVEDDGAGVPEADRERVFESGYSTSPDGPGYGLHIVSRIAEAHDWAISVTDGADGGARFEVRGVAFTEE